MPLSKRHALVTGSTGGIGLAIARALAKDRADFVINGFGDATAIEKTRAEIAGEFGVKALYNRADMSKPEEFAALVKQAEDALGGVGILVNNAGVQIDCVSPGYARTPLVENQIPDTMKARGPAREQLINDVMRVARPTKQFAAAEKAASLAPDLCSDAAAQITGANLSIDGGWTAA